MLTAVRSLARIFLVIASAALGIIVILVAISAIMRHVIGSPFSFTEEVVGLMFAAMAFMSVAYCAIFDRAISVDVLYELIPSPLQLAGRLIAGAATLMFAVWIGWLALDFIGLSYRIGARTDISRITLWPWMSLFVVMVIGLILSVFLRSPADVTSDEGIDLT